MFKKQICLFLALIVFVGMVGGSAFAQSDAKEDGGVTGRLEKMIVDNGSLSLSLNLDRLGARKSRSSMPTDLQFGTEQNSFFTILVFNNELRGPVPSTMPLIPQNEAQMPGKLRESYRQLMLENLSWGGDFDLAIRDSKNGFTFFNIEGQEYSFDAASRQLVVTGGRILLSREFATSLGRPNDAGIEIGKFGMNTTMKTIEVTEYTDGEVKSESLPSFAGSVPGPDVVVGDVSGLAQFGSSFGTQVGLALGTDSCNFGTVDLNWFALPSNDHPVIPQNLYRLSANGGTFEQIGQSQVKHAFTALTNNICSLGCNGVGGTHLGSGCSDPYSASLNAGPSLGSKAWINPFTGAYPRGDSATPPNNHSGHSHTGPSHRILVEIADLATNLNTGATYFAEGQYVTPHEFAWCQANPTQCNMNNNVSYRQYSVTGTTSPFSFSPVSTTQRQKPAINAWTGASFAQIQPSPLTDGIGYVAYKVTNPSPGVWHYEYAVYNQNLDRAIQSFSLPLGNGITLSNFGFHMPAQHPAWTGDGTVGDAGFSSTPWSPDVQPNSVTWQSQTLAQNPNANAIRWGTLYNFRFDSNRPPTTVNATVGFFKTGAPVTVSIQAPQPVAAVNVSIGGRVAALGDEVIRNAIVTLSTGQGVIRTTRTNSFGQYSFDNVTSGTTYTINAVVKGLTFNPLQVTPAANVTDANLTATNNQ